MMSSYSSPSSSSSLAEKAIRASSAHRDSSPPVFFENVLLLNRKEPFVTEKLRCHHFFPKLTSALLLRRALQLWRIVLLASFKKHFAMAMAAKAKLLLRELKMVKSDLAEVYPVYVTSLSSSSSSNPQVLEFK
ncbi:hypothetical protein F2Q69_00016976 [Brassica cretica]|uniref:Uncharacterized protein n=1 Tax=Brassica cretica TaxID=69181 RepID=A0A8S9R2P2_BRACR|nr:hypothetical protein F2Q69_00016976 [Brassica cretica]